MDYNEIDLDKIFAEIGDFGKFQIINYILICFPVFLSSGFVYSYVFTAGNLNYRCKIPECEQDPTQYNTPWISYGIPHRNSAPEKCIYYKLNNSVPIEINCPVESFDRTVEINCNEFVYKDNEKTIVNEFNIMCDYNEWKLTLVGTINNAGQFIFGPIIGYLSDRYGRRNMLIIGILCCGICGLLRSFSINYWMFLCMEFLDAGFGAGIYAAVFILGMEIVGAKKRILGGSIISAVYAIGTACVGLIAMYIPNFRTLLQILYAPTILIIPYFWLVPESMRWLLIQNKFDKFIKVLHRAAKLNNTVLSKFTIDTVNKAGNKTIEEKYINNDDNNNINNDELNIKINDPHPILIIFKSRSLLLRILNCSFCWLTNTFVYYGLSLNSVLLAGNKYVNFILVAIIEIPGFIITFYLMATLGRRWTLCGSLVFSGLACILSPFVPIDDTTWRLVVFLFGKCAITVSFTDLYVYTSELFPTNLRQTLLSTCSTVGRIGSMLAPQAPLLAHYMESLPLYLFGGTAITSGILALHFPETLNTKLPDTIEEAINIGDIKINDAKL